VVGDFQKSKVLVVLYWNSMPKKNPTVIDLFAGVGGISLGAVRAGFSLSLAVELDKHAHASHSLNFPNSKHLQSDITKLNGVQLLKAANIAKGELDGLVGGPPCQGFSIIGQRDATDPRNNLFGKFFELVNECQPRFFIAENVPGILNNKYDDIRKTAFGHIEKNYVMLSPIRLKASDFGIPTSRERVFFIGYRTDLSNTPDVMDFEAQKLSSLVNVGMALEGLPPHIEKSWLTEEQSWQPVGAMSASMYSESIQSKIPDGVGNPRALERYLCGNLVSGFLGTRHSVEIEKRFEQLQPGEVDSISKAVRLKLDGLCPTLRAGTGPEKGSRQAIRPIHPTLPRVITPREAARLQGFPDWFQFSPTKWHSFRQIGNSVSPILAETIFRVISSRLL
jgi:DNA (cytosine-5)-methyltransferase 1